MPNLTTRLVVLLMLALLVITGLYDYLRLAAERERLAERTRQDVRIFAETLALAVGRHIRWGRTSAELAELLDDILARPGLDAVAIFDPAARLVARKVAEGRPEPAADAVVRQVLAEGRALAVPEPGPRSALRHVQPVRWPGGRTGALEVFQARADIEAAFRREIQQRVLWRLVVLVAFLLSVAALTRWSIARPIRALIRGAETLARGDLSLRIPVRRRDELGRLAGAFNRMAEDLEAARRELVRQAAERLRLEQDVQQAEKLAAVGRLATELAHEIGTPLNVIAGRAEGLGRTLPADHPGRRHLGLIQSQADRISEVVRALLDYSRPRRPALVPLAAAPVIGRAAELLRERFEARQVALRLDLPPDLPPVRGDAEQLQRVFLNLLLNALDATPGGSVVRVVGGPGPGPPEEGRVVLRRGEVPEAALALRVTDEGPGIPGDRLPHVFQPFFSTKGREQGTGLGLPIVEDIVRAHHGAIEVASGPGRGTEVTVWLPLADGTLPAGARPPEPAAATPGAGSP